MTIETPVPGRRARRRALALALALTAGSAGLAPALSSGLAAQVSVAQVNGPGLTFGTVFSGTSPVTVAPFTMGDGRGRAAAVFEIQGPASATVEVRVALVPGTIENGSGAALAVTGYSARYNTALSAAGAVPVDADGAWTAVTLSAGGRGYLSVGATVAAAAAQPQGSYSIAGGAAVEVR